MPIIQIRSGAGPDLLADFKHLMRHRRDPLKPLVIIVPSRPVADWLRTRTPLVNVNIVTWVEWLWGLMPSHFRRWPEQADHVLEATMPPDITAHLSRDIPGLYLTVIRAAIECRYQNISPDNLDDNDLALAMTIRWLNRHVFTGDLYDTVRLYEYAREHWSVLESSIDGIIFWGFLSFAPIEWRLIETMGRYHPCVIYGLDASERVNGPREVSLRVLTKTGGGPVRKTISLPKEYLGPQAITRLIAERLQIGVLPQDMMVIADEDDQWRIALALRQVGIAARTGSVVSYEARSIWRALCLGKAAPRSWRRLQDRYPDLADWLNTWGSASDTMTGWDQSRHLVLEAATKIPALAPLAPVVKRWDALSVVYPAPDQDLLRREMTILPEYAIEPPGAYPIEAVWVVRASDAAAMAADEVMVAPEAFRQLSRPWGRGLGLSDGAIPLLQKAHERLVDRVQSRLTEVANNTLFAFGETGERPFHSLWSIQEPKAEPASLAWYAEWYGTGAFGVQTGLPATTISVSDLEKFGACPRAYFLSRGLGLKPWNDDPMRELPALYGQWAHLALYYLSQDPTLSVSVAVRNAMKAVKPPDGLLTTVVRQSQHRLEANLQYVWAGIQAGEVPDSVQAEVEWVWDYRLDKDLWSIRMRLDRLEHYRTHDTVVDFKTGHITNPEKVGPDQLQIPVYLSAWRDRFPDRQSVRGVLWGITEKNHFRAREVLGDEGTDREARRVVDGILGRIRQGEFFPTPDPKSDPCRVCDYRLLCPANVRHIAQTKLVHHKEFMALWMEGNTGADDEA